MNEVAFDVYGDHGITKKQWLTAGDDKVREDHAKYGALGEVDITYTYGDFNMRFPNDPNAPAAEVVNCRCAIAPVVV